MLQLQRTHSPKIYYVLGVAIFLFILGISSLRVQGASSIAQGFQTDSSGVVAGALVSLKSGTANTVELSTPQNVDHMLGIAGENSLIELSSSSGKVPVVTSGETAALVSDINGEVKTGDKITASPIAGVGMKATTSSMVIGTAQADLSSAKPETRSVTDKKGGKQSVKIGAIPVQVDKVFYENSQKLDSYVPQVIQDFANNLAGRSVSPIRVMVAGLLIIFVFITVIVLLYSSIRSSISSIGRNPLSESAVYKSLLQVGLTVFGVMAFTVIVIYLILTT